MLSINRTRMDVVKPSATLEMAAKAKALAKTGVDVANLSAGEPDFKTPLCIVEVAKKALDSRSAHAYTAARGTDELIDAMKQKLKREQKVDYQTAEVIATIGTKGALSLAFDALVGTGDEVVLFAPYWVTYPDLVRLAGGTPVTVPTTIDDGYRPDLAAFDRAITAKTKVVVLNSPNNPTGAGFDEGTLRAIMKRLEGTGIWVVSDEIYERLVYGSFRHVSPASFGPDARSRTLVVGGVAKAYAMTGWRLGIAAGPQPLIDAMMVLQQQRVSCATAVSQAAAAYALTEPPEVTAAVDGMLKAYTERRAYVIERCARIEGARLHPPEGAFYAFLDLSARLPGTHKGRRLDSDVDLSRLLLEEAHVAAVPGSPFEGKGGVRLSYAASLETLDKGLTRIEQFVADLT